MPDPHETLSTFHIRSFLNERMQLLMPYQNLKTTPINGPLGVSVFRAQLSPKS